jgi:hypothetical protein
MIASAIVSFVVGIAGAGLTVYYGELNKRSR